VSNTIPSSPGTDPAVLELTGTPVATELRRRPELLGWSQT